MDTFTQDAWKEFADNWPAFLYILCMVGFSIRFLQERRTETKQVCEIGRAMQQAFNARFDRIERIMADEQTNVKNEVWRMPSEAGGKVEAAWKVEGRGKLQ